MAGETSPLYYIIMRKTHIDRWQAVERFDSKIF